MTIQEGRSPEFPESLRQTFEPLRCLGAGGMGVVFLARDRGLQRRVALKLMLGAGTELERKRFEREARTLCRLRHPAVVRVYSHGEAAEGPYLVMEAVDGAPLSEDAEDADPLPLLLQVAEGLEEVHRAGLVHRDVKPSNVLRTPEGRGVLVDFGLVHDPARTALTGTHDLVGTLGFLAPELLQGALPSPASDWYSWGATLFRQLEGRLPRDPEALMRFLAGSPLAPLRFSKVDPESRRGLLLTALLSEQPEERPGSRVAIETRLSDCSHGVPPVRTRPGSPSRVVPSQAPPPRPVEVRPRASSIGPSTGERGWMLPALLGLGIPLALALGYRVGSTATASRPPAPPRTEARELTEHELADRFLRPLKDVSRAYRDWTGPFEPCWREGKRLGQHVHEVRDLFLEPRFLEGWQRLVTAVREADPSLHVLERVEGARPLAYLSEAAEHLLEDLARLSQEEDLPTFARLLDGDRETLEPEAYRLVREGMAAVLVEVLGAPGSTDREESISLLTLRARVAGHLRDLLPPGHRRGLLGRLRRRLRTLPPHELQDLVLVGLERLVDREWDPEVIPLEVRRALTGELASLLRPASDPPGSPWWTLVQGATLATEFRLLVAFPAEFRNRDRRRTEELLGELEEVATRLAPPEARELRYRCREIREFTARRLASDDSIRELLTRMERLEELLDAPPGPRPRR